MTNTAPAIGSLAAWTPAEKALQAAFETGDVLDLHDTNVAENDITNLNNWSKHRVIRAEVIAQLLLGGLTSGASHPPRLRLSGARITGQLDVGCGTITPFLFFECSFDNRPFLNDAKADFIGFVHCRLPGLSASRLKCSGPVWINESQLSGSVSFEDASIDDFSATGISFTPTGTEPTDTNLCLCLCGAVINHDLMVDHATIAGHICFARASIVGNVSAKGAKIGTGTYAVRADLADVNGSFLAPDGFKASGLVSLEGIKIGGRLRLDHAVIEGRDDVVLHLDHAQIKLGILARDLNVRGGIRMHHAMVGCQATFSRAVIVNPRGTALQADHLVVNGSLHLDDSARVAGIIDLHGAEVQCTLSLDKLQITTEGDTTLALWASDLRVGGNVSAEGIDVQGRVDISAGRIGGSIDLTDAQLVNPARVTLNASRAEIGSSLKINGSFSSQGTIMLTDSSIGTILNANNAKLSKPDGKALSAVGLSVKGDVLFECASVAGLVDLTASEMSGDVRFADSQLTGVPRNDASHGAPIDRRTGEEWRGIALRLTSANVNGDVDLRGATLSETLVLRSTRIGRSVRLDRTTLGGSEQALNASGLIVDKLQILPKTRPVGAVILESAQVELIVDEPGSWPTTSETNLKGLTYHRIESSMSVNDRLRWLEKATPQFAPHPYEQLARCYVDAGSDGHARRVRLEATRRAHRAGNILVRCWGHLQDILLGYGFLPVRAIMTFMILWAGAAIWFANGSTCVVVHVTKAGLCPINPTAHLTWDPWLYSLDLLVPVVNLGQENAWDPVGLSKVVMYILVITGWVLTTTIIAAAGRSFKRS